MYLLLRRFARICCIDLLQSHRSSIKCHFNPREFATRVVPLFPQWREIKAEDLPSPRILSDEEVEHLESISLVQYKNTKVEKARLENTICFADSLRVVNTDGIEPMIHVFDDEYLHLRDDVVTHNGCASEILKNAKIVEEDYFVAPPGNVSLLDSNQSSTGDRS